MWKWCIATHRICCCHLTFSKSEEAINHFQIHLICWHDLLISELEQIGFSRLPLTGHVIRQDLGFLVAALWSSERWPGSAWGREGVALKFHPAYWNGSKMITFLGSPKSWHFKFWTAKLLPCFFFKGKVSWSLHVIAFVLQGVNQTGISIKNYLLGWRPLTGSLVTLGLPIRTGYRFTRWEFFLKKHHDFRHDFSMEIPNWLPCFFCWKPQWMVKVFSKWING